jgi:hypothetical protein
VVGYFETVANTRDDARKIEERNHLIKRTEKLTEAVSTCRTKIDKQKKLIKDKDKTIKSQQKEIAEQKKINQATENIQEAWEKDAKKKNGAKWGYGAGGLGFGVLLGVLLGIFAVK